MTYACPYPNYLWISHWIDWSNGSRLGWGGILALPLDIDMDRDLEPNEAMAQPLLELLVLALLFVGAFELATAPQILWPPHPILLLPSLQPGPVKHSLHV